MIALTALIAVAAPVPLGAGVHRCGVQWSSYGELCTITVDGESATIVSQGPSVKLSGKIIPIDANNFMLDGDLEVLGVPVAYTDLTRCPGKGPFKFRHTGKRKFFRHTQTCPDMTTSYFDIFIDTIDPKAIELEKRLSAMTGKFVHDSRASGCAAITNELVAAVNDPICDRWGDSGLGTPYYSCPIAGAAGRLYIFDKQKACKEIADRLTNPE